MRCATSTGGCDVERLPVRNCLADEGDGSVFHWPLGVGLQEQAPNHSRRRWPNGYGRERGEKVRPGAGRGSEYKDDNQGTTEYVSKTPDDVETVGCNYHGTSSGEACRRTERHPAYRWRERTRGGRTERGNLRAVAGVKSAPTGEATSGASTRASVRTPCGRGGAPRSSVEAAVMAGERRGCAVAAYSWCQPDRGGAHA